MLVNDLNIKFNKDGLIPAIIQEQETKEILMLAYMNEDSLKKSLDSGLTHFWSRSQKKIWQKGESSGHIQRIQKISLDCDYDSLLIEVQQIGLACHTGRKSCFYQDIYSLNEKEAKDLASSQILDSLYTTILERKKNPPQDSYTGYLFKEGLDKILKKVGEEASEVIIAAKNEDPAETIYETADLIYHLLVTLVEKDIKLQDIYQELAKRRK